MIEAYKKVNQGKTEKNLRCPLDIVHVSSVLVLLLHKPGQIAAPMVPRALPISPRLLLSPSP